VSLDQLWAGWRSAYVSGASTEAARVLAGTALPPCVFCTILESESVAPARQVVHLGRHTAVVLNAFPYTSGHVLVLPRRHVGDLGALSEEEAADLWSEARRAVRAIESAYQPDGINLGANLGKAAGAGIPDHLHLHALPRWQGDTNFMTTVAGTRVQPEELDTTWQKLRAAWPGDT
jgi:ATP adenylyltransferase